MVPYISHDTIQTIVGMLDKATLAQRFEHLLAAVQFTYDNAGNYDNPEEAQNLKRLMLAAMRDAMELP